MSFKFEYEGRLSDGRFFDNTSKKKVTFELDDNDFTVSELLEEFMNFMQGVGYKFEIGDRFDVVNDLKQFDRTQSQTDFDWTNKDPIVDEGGSIIGTVDKPIYGGTENI